MTTYAITGFFSDPFWTGTVSSSPTGNDYHVNLGGVGYMIDWESGAFSHRSIPATRQQADSSTEPGEQTLNPEDLWPRAQSSWHGGAGQTYLDLTDQDGGTVSTRKRFRTSKGLDPWTYGELRLLPSVTQAKAATGSNARVVVAGSYVYLLDNDKLYRTADLSSWTEVTAASTALSSPQSIATDGRNVWVIDGTNLYYTTTAGTTYAKWHPTGTNPGSLVRYAKGRLFTANGVYLYNNKASTEAPPTAVTDALNTGTFFVNTGWAWTDVAEGPNAIYASGYAGDKSLIYRTGLSDNATALEALVVAGELPDGEVARSMCGYLGGLLVGTDQGVRYAALDQSGNISAFGDLIPTDSPVYCFEPQERFVWFGLTNQDSSSTGLGRIDLRTFTADLTPAWASDLYAETQGTVLSAVTFGGRRVFTVASVGCYAEDATGYVTEGSLTTGWCSYGLPHLKTAVQLDVTTAAGAGSYAPSLATDQQSTAVVLGAELATSAVRGEQRSWSTNLVRAETFEVRLSVSGDGTDTPVIKRWVLRAEPSSVGGRRIIVPLLLHENVIAGNEHRRTIRVDDERDRLIGLHEAKTVTSYQEGASTYRVIVEDYQWVPYGKRARSRGGYDGTFVATLKEVRVT